MKFVSNNQSWFSFNKTLVSMNSYNIYGMPFTFYLFVVVVTSFNFGFSFICLAAQLIYQLSVLEVQRN